MLFKGILYFLNLNGQWNYRHIFTLIPHHIFQSTSVWSLFSIPRIFLTQDHQQTHTSVLINNTMQLRNCSMLVSEETVHIYRKCWIINAIGYYRNWSVLTISLLKIHDWNVNIHVRTDCQCWWAYDALDNQNR